MTTASSTRRDELLRRYAELAENVRVWVNAHGRTRAGVGREVEGILRALDEAEARAKTGELGPATKILERLSERIASRQSPPALDLEAERPRARAQVERTLASAALAEAYRARSASSAGERLRPALESFSRGERQLASGDYVRGAESFRRAAAILEGILREVTLSALEERLRALRKRRSRLVEAIRRLPTRDFTERQRDGAMAAIRRLDQALEAADEVRAATALAECEAFLESRPPPPSPPPSRRVEEPADQRRPGSAWPLAVAAAIGFASIATGLRLWELPAVPSALWPAPIAAVPAARVAPADPRPAVSAASAASRWSRSESALRPAPQPAAAATRLARIREASAARSATAEERADLGIDLLDSSPQTTSLALPSWTGRELGAAARRDGRRLRWELDGVVAGEGERLSFDPASAPRCGVHRLALVATEGERRVILEAWRLTIAAATAPAPRPTPLDAEKETELLVWIDRWCSACGRSDVEPLVRVQEVELEPAPRLSGARSGR